MAKVGNCKILNRSAQKDDKFLAGCSFIGDSGDAPFLLCCLYRQLSSLLESKPSDRRVIQESEAKDPTYTAPFWIKKWAKSSRKRGFCYELCNRSVGILFDDGSQLTMDKNGQRANFVDKVSSYSFSMDQWPAGLESKRKLLETFCRRRPQVDHVFPSANEDTKLDSLPQLLQWRVSPCMLVLQLTDGTVQVNFLTDHSRIVFSPSLSSMSWIDSDRNVVTYRLQLLERHGCRRELLQRVQYAKRMIELLILENEDCLSALSNEGYDIA